jgi:hypothetical protein
MVADDHPVACHFVEQIEGSPEQIQAAGRTVVPSPTDRPTGDTP